MKHKLDDQVVVSSAKDAVIYTIEEIDIGSGAVKLAYDYMGGKSYSWTALCSIKKPSKDQLKHTLTNNRK